MYVVNTAQMQAAEQAANAAGISYERLMENAGHAVAQAIALHTDVAEMSVLVLVGPGNNGGDGLVAARYLAQMGAAVTVYVWKRDISNDKNWAILAGLPVEKILVTDADSDARLHHLLAETSLIIDALLGTGISRPIDDHLAGLLDTVRAYALDNSGPGMLIDPTQPWLPEPGPFIVAVDVPSGLNSDTGAVDPYTLPANLTVTFAAVKYGHLLFPGPEVVGQLIVADIEVAPEHYPADITLTLTTAQDVAEMLPDRPLDANKGTFGKVLVVAGSINYPGAAGLSSLAATRIGAGLVMLAIPEVVYPVLASQLLNVTYLPLPAVNGAFAAEGASFLQAQTERMDALLIGPGLGQTQATAQFLSDILATRDALPSLVIDADALNILSGQPHWWDALPPLCVLTPHPGEMARLTAQTIDEVQANRVGLALAKAAEWQQVVLLKGANTVIAAPDGRATVLPFANPALAKAGSGDILAGVIVGLLAQGLAPFEAAVSGAYIHGMAGDIARESIGTTSVVASDLLPYLAAALRDLEAES